MAKRKYIAYGSNLNVQQMKWRCPNAEIMGTGELKDWRLLFKGSKTGAYLTIEKCKGYSVPFAVWEVDASDEAALDRYEGFPSFYYKQELSFEYKGIKTGIVHSAHEVIVAQCRSGLHHVDAEVDEIVVTDGALLREATVKSSDPNAGKRNLHWK